MKRSFFYICFTLVLFQAESSRADFFPNIKYYNNKLVDAWDDDRYSSDINDFSVDEDLVVDDKKLDRINFDQLARWQPSQVEFYLRAHQYLLKHGIDTESGWFKKALGQFGFLVGYEYRVDPSFRDGSYTRIDRYAMRPVLGIQNTLKRMSDAKVLLQTNPSYVLEYGFYRQFKSSKKAIIAKPYFHHNLPFDGNHAINGLKTGDIFHFKSRLNILVDTSFISDLITANVGVSVGAHYVASGNFEVYVIRLPDSKVQLRILGGRSHQYGASGSVGVDSIKVVGVDVVDGLIGSGIGLEVMSAKIQKRLNEGLLVDYIVDLKKPNALKAFDESMLKIRTFNYMSVVDPREGMPEFCDKMLLNLTALEVERLASGNSHVQRVFGLNNEASVNYKNFSIGNKLLSYRLQTHNSKSEFEGDQDDDGEIETYVMNTRQTKGSFNFLFSLFKSEVMNKTTLIEEDSIPVGIAMESELTDKKFSQRDLKNARIKLERLIPQVYEQLDFNSFERVKLEAVGIKTLVVFTNDALMALPELDEKTIKARYEAYLRPMTLNDLLNNHNTGKSHVDLRQDLRRKISASTKLLKKLVSKKTDLNSRAEIFMELSKQKIFKATGYGFLMSLMPTDLWKKLVYVEVMLNSTKGPGISYISGPAGPGNLYAHLIHYENLLNVEEVEFRMFIDLMALN